MKISKFQFFLVRTPSSSVAVFNLDSRKNYSSTETFAPKLSSNYLDGLRIERGHFVYSPIPTYEILLKSVNLSSRSKISNGSKRYPSKKIGVSFFLRGGDTKNRSSRHSGQTDYTSVLKELEPIHILSPPPKKKKKTPISVARRMALYGNIKIIQSFTIFSEHVSPQCGY